MHRRPTSARCAIVLGALAWSCLFFSTSTLAAGYRLMPIVDGSGALGQATAPNGAMSGDLYVPERQATRPPVYRPRGRTDGRQLHRRYRGHRRPHRHRRYRHDNGYDDHRRANRYGRAHARGERGRHVPRYGRRGGGMIDRDNLSQQPRRPRSINPYYVTPNRRRLDERLGPH